jgi:hypothetical protein
MLKRIVVYTFLFFFLLISKVSAQDTSDVSPNLVQKSYFFFKKLNLKKYSTTIHPHYYSWALHGSFSGGTNNQLFHKLEYTVINMPFSKIMAYGGLGKTRVDTIRITELDSAVSLTTLDIGAVYLERFGYHYLHLGTGTSFFANQQRSLAAFLWYIDIGYRKHNPTKRISWKLGYRTYPHWKYNLSYFTMEISYAFGKK